MLRKTEGLGQRGGGGTGALGSVGESEGADDEDEAESDGAGEGAASRSRTMTCWGSLGKYRAPVCPQPVSISAREAKAEDFNTARIASRRSWRGHHSTVAQSEPASCHAIEHPCADDQKADGGGGEADENQHEWCRDNEH